MIDRKQQTAIYNALAPRLFGICKRYLPDDDDATDALQLSFIKIFNKYHTLQNSNAINKWAERITINTTLNYLRDKKVEFISIDPVYSNDDIDTPIYELGIQLEDIQPNPEQQINYDELLNMLNALPNGYKTVFNLFYIDGYNHYEIADMLGISINTSKSQALKAKRKLQEIYKHLNIL